MRSWRRAALHGLGLWAGIVVVSLVLLPLEDRQGALHESLKLTAMVAIALAFTILHLRRVADSTPAQGLAVGIVWAAIVVALDLALYAAGAFNIGIGEYFSDVASSYLVIPAVTTLAMGFLRGK